MLDLDNIGNTLTPAQHCKKVAAKEKQLRKKNRLTQQQLASKAGVSLGSLRRFEQTGEISFHSLSRIMQALECAGDLDKLFANKYYKSIQEVIDEQNRK